MKSLAHALVLTLAATAAAAQLPQHRDVSSLTPYTPSATVSGNLRVYGNNYIPALMKRWQEGFQAFHPGVTFTTVLPGTEAAMAGLYSGIADIAFLGREAYSSELAAFNERYGYPPLGIEISSGSFGTPHKTFSLEVFVHRNNPVTGLTLNQLRAIFSCPATGENAVRTWGDLGVSGTIATHPVHVYGYQFDTGMARYFNRVVLHESGAWTEDLKDFDNGRDSSGEVINAGVYILKALEDDPDGIAFANMQYVNPKIKPIGLAVDAGAPFVQPTSETVWDRSYPLHRFTTLYLNRKPNTPVDPLVREFITYLLSREGMQAVAGDGAYTPLNEAVARDQRKKLE